MPLQPPTYVGLLDPTDPKGTDSRTISDDYHRMIQESCRQTTPNYTNEVTATHSDTNLLSGYVANGVKPMPGEGGVTTIFHYGTTAPTGWTISEPDANLRELIIGPAAGGGVIGGSQDPTNMTDTVTINFPANTGGHVLTISQLPSHNHTIASRDSESSVFTGAARNPASTNNIGNISTSSVGSNEAHSHTIGGSDSDTVTLTPRYARGILMQLDA